MSPDGDTEGKQEVWRTCVQNITPLKHSNSREPPLQNIGRLAFTQQLPSPLLIPGYTLYKLGTHQDIQKGTTKSGLN